MDAAIIWKDLAGDIQLNGYDLAREDGLTTAVIISLFTDRRAANDDVPPGDARDLRGWWADAFPAVPGDQIGARLWLLHREKQTQSVLNRARDYAEEALQWLLEDGIVKSIRVTAEIVRQGVLGLSIDITRPDGKTANYKFKQIWEAHLNAV